MNLSVRCGNCLSLDEIDLEMLLNKIEHLHDAFPETPIPADCGLYVCPFCGYVCVVNEDGVSSPASDAVLHELDPMVKGALIIMRRNCVNFQASSRFSPEAN